METNRSSITDNIAPSAEEMPLRRARLDDVGQIYILLKDYADKGKLLPRPESDIYQSLREFIVIHQDDVIIGCCALQIFTQDLGEVRSLAVHPDYAGKGIGSRLVRQLEIDAREIGLSRLMALTYEERFFNRAGYQVVEMKRLPEKVWGACINCPKFRNCDEIAVLKHL